MANSCLYQWLGIPTLGFTSSSTYKTSQIYLISWTDWIPFIFSQAWSLPWSTSFLCSLLPQPALLSRMSWGTIWYRARSGTSALIELPRAKSNLLSYSLWAILEMGLSLTRFTNAADRNLQKSFQLSAGHVTSESMSWKWNTPSLVICSILLHSLFWSLNLRKSDKKDMYLTKESWLRWRLKAPKNVQCCIAKSCFPPGTPGGSCRNTNKGCPGGKFTSWVKPPNQFCLKKTPCIYLTYYLFDKLTTIFLRTHRGYCPGDKTVQCCHAVCCNQARAVDRLAKRCVEC